MFGILTLVTNLNVFNIGGFSWPSFFNNVRIEIFSNIIEQIGPEGEALLTLLFDTCWDHSDLEMEENLDSSLPWVLDVGTEGLEMCASTPVREEGVGLASSTFEPHLHLVSSPI